MRDPAQKKLIDLLGQKIEALSEVAIREQGAVPTEQIKDATNLKQLAELQEWVSGASHQKRWILPAVVIVTLSVTSVLLFTHLPEARVDLALESTSIAFTLDEAQDLVSNVRVSGISGSGLQRIDASEFENAGQSAPANSSEGDSFRLSVVGKKGSITLENVHLPSETGVTLERLEGPGRFRIAWKLGRNQKSDALRISSEGEIQLGMSASPPRVLHLTAPKGLELVPEKEVTLDLDLVENSELATEPQLLASMLSFTKVHEFVGAVSNARQVSTIRSGWIFIQSLNGQKYEVREGERLRFSDSRGEIQRITLGPSGISVQYEGKVQGMSVGSREFPTSLMPSLLEWLRARHGLSLLWASTLYLVGLLTVGLRWLRIIR